MNEMTSIGREEWPANTMVIFRNYQWGAEKRNTTLWCGASSRRSAS
jgi:sulfoacetaldehyde acetyltransferase